MKKIYSNKIFFVPFTVLLLFLAILYLNNKYSFFSFFPTNKVNSLPTSFQDCDRRTSKKGNFNPADYIFPFCDYFVEENNSLYQQCVSNGGVKTAIICANCPGCGCTPAGCRITYIDPNFNLPTNFNECSKVFTHSGGSSIYENGGRENCAILLPKQGVFNKEIGEQLIKTCFNQNGKTFEDNDNCELIFYKE